jgi:7-alpha-hydroxysteroid dehydrogenase
MKNPFSLAGKIAIVTGSGRGIGAGIAKVFAEAGATLALVARTQSQLDETAAEIRAAGGRAITIPADLTNISILPGIIERTVEELGGIDILVNNAGGGFSKKFVDIRIEDIESIFRLEVSVPFELTRLALPHLLNRPGANIINTVSPGAYMSPRGFLPHYIAKTSLAHLTRLMAADLGPRIRVNAVNPSMVETPALKKALESVDPAIKNAMIGSTRMRRTSKPEEVGYAALYLASPAAAFVTGTILDVNGGHVHEIMQMYPDL